MSRGFKRSNRLLRERIHDPYRARVKLREASSCPQCGVQYRNGRWIWPRSSSRGLKRQLCPACLRINDGYPAGEVVLSGGFVGTKRDEILAMVRHVEAAEQSEHPLNRILAIDERDDAIVIATTDIHLPHRLAHAIKDAWGGTMRTHYDTEGYFTRVQWERDA